LSDPCDAQPRRGTLVVLSAPSGTGKTTLVRRLRDSLPGLAVSVSTTTRPPRTGEVDGVHYHFLSEEVFLQRRAEGAFLEHAEVHGNLYGTLREPVERERAAGRDVLLEIDVEGARQIRAADPDARLVFILPPSREELERRLRTRGLDPPDVIARRLENAAREVARAGDYDHAVVNVDLDEALRQLLCIVGSYHLSTRAQAPRIAAIQATFGTEAGASR
jgi:guanylate kinase